MKRQRLERQRMLIRAGGALLVGVCLTCGGAMADDSQLSDDAVGLLRQFCFDCHSGEQAEADVDLRGLSEDRTLTRGWKTWRTAVAMLQTEKMPPEDATQPDDRQRRRLLETIGGQLRRLAESHARDPGELVLRRLTAAEFEYTIRDLTGLRLELDRLLVGDAVGGEGFTNVGAAQFVQEVTLERYLAAAKKVAAHTIVGAGPLAFFRSPGKTGLELSAIERIQRIYRDHGFRTAAGEGGEAFGMDRYPRAFYATWRYRHRQRLGLGDATFESLAREAGLDARFVEYIWRVLNAPSSSYPTSEIATRWRELPAPESDDERFLADVRRQCAELHRILQVWQETLGQNADDKEQAFLLSADTFEVARSKSFVMTPIRPDETGRAKIFVRVESVRGDPEERPMVVWRRPAIQFRIDGTRLQDPRPLREALSKADAAKLHFGKRPDGGKIDEGDFATAGGAVRSFTLRFPPGATSAKLSVEARLAANSDCVLRSMISEADGAEQGKTVLGLLADPAGEVFAAWAPGVIDFARTFPQVSHREAAPSDRDPIPSPFDNSYNNPERNWYHYKIKYHRDDRFLVENILGDETRRRLDLAWHDLLGSFEYHDTYLKFVSDKFDLGLKGSVAELSQAQIEALPEEARDHVQRLRRGYLAVEQAFRDAEAGHLEDAFQFAGRAWRRPLAENERKELRSFYRTLKDENGLDHSRAIRTLLVRILTSPDFLYRAERPAASADVVPLSDWELANRLSYFLWSSLPDEELRRAAAAGELSDPDELVRQARRMLRDPKAGRLAEEFFGQWLGFYRFDDYRGIDSGRFPELTPALKESMHEEALAFFSHIVREDRPLDEILFADYTFLNDELARHYGLDEAPDDSELKLAPNVGPARRGGLLGLGAVLTVTSAPLRTSPVKRGDWILRRLLGTPVPPPPPDAGSIAPEEVAAGLTVRQRLEAHRSAASCRNCHSRIDPLGFALERYDAIGRWRESYLDGQPIDDFGVLSDGTPIAGPTGLREYLASQRDSFHRTLSTKLAGYALGRGESLCDALLIEEMMEQLSAGAGLSSLVDEIVTSRQFRYRRGQ